MKDNLKTKKEIITNICEMLVDNDCILKGDLNPLISKISNGKIKDLEWKNIFENKLKIDHETK